LRHLVGSPHRMLRIDEDRESARLVHRVKPGLLPVAAQKNDTILGDAAAGYHEIEIGLH
jgi:hypothetical protein